MQGASIKGFNIKQLKYLFNVGNQPNRMGQFPLLSTRNLSLGSLSGPIRGTLRCLVTQLGCTKTLWKLWVEQGITLLANAPLGAHSSTCKAIGAWYRKACKQMIPSMGRLCRMYQKAKSAITRECEHRARVAKQRRALSSTVTGISTLESCQQRKGGITAFTVKGMHWPGNHQNSHSRAWPE